MQTPSNQTKNKIGIVQIQTSRGLLIHKVGFKDDVITNYQIVTPTEWSFQRGGVVELSLQTTLGQHAALIINAIDPCVGFELVID